MGIKFSRSEPVRDGHASDGTCERTVDVSTAHVDLVRLQIALVG